MALFINSDDPDTRRAAMALTVFVEQALQRSEAYPKLTPLDFAVLRYLAQMDDEGGAPTPDIVRTFKLATPSGFTLVQRLLELDLITNEPLPGRQRPRRARLNANGWKALEADPLERAFAELLPQLDKDACTGLFEALIPADFTQERWRDLKLGPDFWR